KHAVFGGQPALALALQEAGHGFLDAGGAQHAGFAELDEHGAFGMAGEMTCDAHRTELVGASLVVSHAISYLLNFRIVALISSIARSMSSSLNSTSPAPSVVVSKLSMCVVK